ncbi:L-lactate dehydrogenase [Parvibaculum sedimenti]|uniref:L-lactate dehydrogenase n=1 Tax=Parvibaculum sedimenti TaxID=2608632 RepID=A0A6N6VK72_9HYPH|nr:L-lactate dehydrogenase [Parvibaculum sedimenti]KAB7741120.1 L-lactate dehydrogenase [Parvibaculum sedimenti]
MTRPASVSDWRLRAQKRLPRMMFDYIDGGAYAEATLRRNVAAMEEIALRQRVLTDVSKLKLSTELFGQTLAMPVILGPVGMAGLYAHRGETQAARAAEAAGLPFCLSTVSICSLEEVRKSVAKPFWFQLYMIRDRGFMMELLNRAKEAGSPVLVFTVDLPVTGARYRDVRSGLSGELTLADKLRRGFNVLSHPRWMREVFIGGRPHTFGNIAHAMPNAKGTNDFAQWIGKNFDPSVTWRDFEWVRARWDGPIVIKGILDPEDARMAAEVGADGIVVSNHGGRQLDGVPASVDALPPIVEAVGSRLDIVMDGGVRSGLDVLKALALGAKSVAIGRAWAYALAGGGEVGVSAMLKTLKAELEVAMALTGCTDVETAGRSLLVEHS